MGVCTTRNVKTVREIEFLSRVDGKRRNLARVSDLRFGTRLAGFHHTKSLFPSTSVGTCFSHDKKETFTCFTVKLAS